MWEQTLAIFIVLGLLMTSLWLLRRKGFARVNVGLGKALGSSKRMEVLERMPLTPQHSLHLVRVEGRVLLIGVSPGTFTAVDLFSKQTEQERRNGACG